MKKSTKYSAMIVAALFAVTPIALNNKTNVVKAETSANNVTNHQSIQPSENIKDAVKINYQINPNIAKKIKKTDKLTLRDIYRYISNQITISANGKNLDVANKCSFNIFDKNHNAMITPKTPNPNIKDAQYLYYSVAINLDSLKPNTWYQWIQPVDLKAEFNSYNKNLTDVVIPEEVLSRLAETKLSNHEYLVSEKTDNKGHLPNIQIKHNKYLGIINFARSFSLSKKILLSDDSDAVEIPHIAQPTKPQASTPSIKPNQDSTPQTSNISKPNKPEAPEDKPVVPSTPSTNNQPTQATDTTSTTSVVSNDANNSTASSETKSNSKTNNSTETKQETSNKVNTDKSKASSSTFSSKKPLMYSHNAFVYNRKGKLVKHHGMYILKRRNHNLNAWNNGKVITIKGKKFYQIGKNSFVKVANTTARPKAQKFIHRGIVKGLKKGKKVRLYNANGKFTKKYVSTKKTLKFNQKKFINGHLFYRIENSNNWIRSNKVKINK